MAYYTYDSTLLSLGPTVLICISKEWCCKEELHGIGNLEFEPVIYGDFSEGQLNSIGL